MKIGLESVYNIVKDMKTIHCETFTIEEWTEIIKCGLLSEDEFLLGKKVIGLHLYYDKIFSKENIHKALIEIKGLLKIL